jgi:hypothetical protein
MASLLTVLVAMFLGGVIYFAMLKAFKVDEMDYLWDGLKRKLFRRRSAATAKDETVAPEPGESMD